jgi:hypothetical protein
LTIWFLQRWGPAAENLAPGGPWRWATIPSVRSHRGGEHPLHRIVAAVLRPESEVVLTPVRRNNDRIVDPHLFEVNEVLSNSSVLLIDDSWTTGSNVISAAAALRATGATAVNAMVLGRILNTDWAPSRTFIERGGLRSDFHDGLRRGFDPARSPWRAVPNK